MFRYNFFDRVAVFFKSKTMLSNIVAINVLVWIFMTIVNVFSFLFQTDIFGIKSTVFAYLGFSSSINDVYLKPWTLITYQFLHTSFFHLLFNMIMLYFCGQLFFQYLSKQKFLAVYLLGGIAGALIYIVSYSFFPVFSSLQHSACLIGASASVLSVFFALVAKFPNMKINLVLLGEIKLKYLALLFLAIDLLSINSSNPGGHFAHIGGALLGFLYIGLPLKIKEKKQSRFTFKTKKKPSKPKPTKNVDIEEAYHRNKVEQQKEIDRILEKISKSGYDKLTKSEKETLFKR